MRIITAILLMAILFGCTHQPEFLPEINFSQPELEWKQRAASLVQKGTFSSRVYGYDTLYGYKWHLQDTSLNVYVRLNRAFISNGPLTVFSFDFNSYPKDEPPQANAFSASSRPKEAFVSETVFGRIKKHIDAKYGTPDSVGQSDNDTTYYYHEPSFELILEKASPYPDTGTMSSGPGESYYQEAMLYVASKDHGRVQDSLKLEFKKAAKPKELVSIELNIPRLTRSSAAARYVTPALEIGVKREMNTSLFDQKLVEAVKGDLRITDRFGDALFVKEDIEYKAGVSLAPFAPFFPTGKQWTLQLIDGQSATKRLRDAIKLQTELRVEFVPTAIYYEDGTIFR
jgi:hypothetical protein